MRRKCCWRNLRKMKRNIVALSQSNTGIAASACTPACTCSACCSTFNMFRFQAMYSECAISSRHEIIIHIGGSGNPAIAANRMKNSNKMCFIFNLSYIMYFNSLRSLGKIQDIDKYAGTFTEHHVEWAASTLKWMYLVWEKKKINVFKWEKVVLEIAKCQFDYRATVCWCFFLASFVVSTRTWMRWERIAQHLHSRGIEAKNAG